MFPGGKSSLARLRSKLKVRLSYTWFHDNGSFISVPGFKKFSLYLKESFSRNIQYQCIFTIFCHHKNVLLESRKGGEGRALTCPHTFIGEHIFESEITLSFLLSESGYTSQSVFSFYALHRYSDARKIFTLLRTTSKKSTFH